MFILFMYFNYNYFCLIMSNSLVLIDSLNNNIDNNNKKIDYIYK